MFDLVRRGAGIVPGLALLLGACGSGPPASSPPPSTQPAGEAVVVAAGDIARCGDPNSQLTGLLLDAVFPPGTALSAGFVLPLGDNAYPDGTLEQYQQCYDPTWGAHLARSRPVPGNHDYHVPEAQGYFDYFGSQAGTRGRGYYSYDLGAWHIVALNSNCKFVAGGCDRGSEMESWLRDDLAQHRSRCSLAYWHHARFSSGSMHGSDPRTRDLWAALAEFDADLVLNAHEHVYERIGPRNADGGQDALHGMREFVVGTGGAELYGFGPPEPDVEARDNQHWGVLRLTLRPESYAWQFIATTGSAVLDEGEASCH